MKFQFLAIIEFSLAELTLDNGFMCSQVMLEMIFRCNFFVAHLTCVHRNFNSVESRVSREQLSVDETLLAIFVRTLVGFISCVSC